MLQYDANIGIFDVINKLLYVYALHTYRYQLRYTYYTCVLIRCQTRINCRSGCKFNRNLLYFYNIFLNIILNLILYYKFKFNFIIYF